MTPVNEEMLQYITATIVREVDPVKIILFGSYARGDAGAHSDLDLLIVDELQTRRIKSRRAQLGHLYRVLAGIGVGKDLLLYSLEEYEKWSDTINHVVARANSEGRVLYARN